MKQTTVKVEGMMCSMCESHVNDAIRQAFPGLKKVKSSHAKGETVILSEEDLDQDKLKAVISETGYTVGPITVEEKKKGLLGLFG